MPSESTTAGLAALLRAATSVPPHCIPDIRSGAMWAAWMASRSCEVDNDARAGRRAVSVDRPAGTTRPRAA